MVKSIIILSIFPCYLFGVIRHSGGTDLNSIIGQFRGNISKPVDNPNAVTQINVDVDEEGNIIVENNENNNNGNEEENSTTITIIDDSIYGDDHSQEYQVTTYTPTASSGGDQDNDVPTLQAILRSISYLDQDNDREWLEKIYNELRDQNTEETELSLDEIDFDDSKFSERDDSIFKGENQNPLEGLNPTGTLPNLTFYVPSISEGQTQHSVNFEDSKWENLFLVAKLGLTSLVVIGSIRGTSWSAGQILGS